MTTLAERLEKGAADATGEFQKLSADLGVRLIADHEGALLRGAFVERRPVPAAQYLELARSWEQFDRAFAPATDTAEAYALAQLALFVRRSGIAGDLGDHILFVVARAGAPDVLVSLGDDAWDDWLASIQRCRMDGHAAADRLREHLQQGPRPDEPVPGQDP